MEIDLLDVRLSRVEDDISRLDHSVEKLRAELADERIASARLAEQVDAHDRRGNERHAEILSTLGSMRQDQRAAVAAGAAREARLAKIALAVISILGTAVAALVGAR